MRNRNNEYICNLCGGAIVTHDMDEGTTPFMLGCRATAGCTGAMQSQFYPDSVQNTPATFVWRKPTEKEYTVANAAMRDHFEKGGMDIHKIGEA